MGDFTQEDAARLAETIIGFGERSDDEIIARVAAAQPADAEPPFAQTTEPWIAAGEPDEDTEGLRSGCPDTGPPPNPWRAD